MKSYAEQVQPLGGWSQSLHSSLSQPSMVSWGRGLSSWSPIFSIMADNSCRGREEEGRREEEKEGKREGGKELEYEVLCRVAHLQMGQHLT